VTLHEALKAHEELKSQGVLTRLIDLYCIKPLNGRQIAEQLKAAAASLITVEDHYPEGGIGEAVLSALAETGAAPKQFVKLAVRQLPPSGKPDELMDAFGISTRHIIAAIRGLD